MRIVRLVFGTNWFRIVRVLLQSLDVVLRVGSTLRVVQGSFLSLELDVPGSRLLRVSGILLDAWWRHFSKILRHADELLEGA